MRSHQSGTAFGTEFRPRRGDGHRRGAARRRRSCRVARTQVSVTAPAEEHRGGRMPVRRDILPIPDRPYEGPGTAATRRILRRRFRRSSRCGRRPERRTSGRSSSTTSASPLERVRRTVRDADERLADGSQVQPLPHDGALRADAAALLTGRNHHSVGMGVITELATSAPGYNSIRPNTCAPLAQTLR